MKRLLQIGPILLIGALLAGRAVAESDVAGREIFPPAQGNGAIVVVISGASGTALYRDFSSNLAKSGYYTVLIKGYDVIPDWNARDQRGLANLRAVIADSQSAPQAIPGKVALVGLSLGGAGALLHGAPLKDQVAAIVAFYPALTRLASDMKPLAASLQVPVLVLAGEKDVYDGCCMIESAKALDAAPKTVPFELVVYPNAGHGFNLQNDWRFDYREADAADAWARTLTFLKRLHPPRSD
jgi:carboxymethylenebutenolidase